jgi:hypothetical protein
VVVKPRAKAGEQLGWPGDAEVRARGGDDHGPDDRGEAPPQGTIGGRRAAMKVVEHEYSHRPGCPQRARSLVIDLNALGTYAPEADFEERSLPDTGRTLQQNRRGSAYGYGLGNKTAQLLDLETATDQRPVTAPCGTPSLESAPPHNPPIRRNQVSLRA